MLYRNANNVPSAVMRMTLRTATITEYESIFENSRYSMNGSGLPLLRSEAIWLT